MTNLSDRTPVEIDTEIASLDRALMLAERELGWALAALCEPAGCKRTRAIYRGGRSEYVHSLTADECVAALVELRDNAGDELPAGVGFHWDYDEHRRMRPSDFLARVARWSREVTDLETTVAELEAEHSRRRWSRMFLVVSSAGHIHSSRSCSTCRISTRYGWQPALSGATEAEAIELLGSRADALCSVCFPTAPVAAKRTNITKAQALKMAGMEE